jgi:hypothetical protein
MRIWPESAGCAPDRHRIRVVLPAPLPPTRPDDLARSQVDGDVLDRVNAAERDADVLHLDQRSGARGRRSGRSGSGVGAMLIFLLLAYLERR